MIDVTDFDPIEDGLIASFSDAGDVYAGAILAADERDGKYGRCPMIALQLDEPFEDDDVVLIQARSTQMWREIRRKVRHAGRKAVTEGDWMRVEYVEEREPVDGGNPYKVYAVSYKRTEKGDEKALGTGESVNGGYQASLFDDRPNF